VPRSYRLGERAAQIKATSERIVDAALELYLEVGISSATMRAIGARADVAPGTLRSHFPSREMLDRAMVDRLTSAITLPDVSIFDGARTMEERIARLIHAGGVFMDQARRLYRMWLREPMLTPPWTEKGAEYGARWDALMRTALGPLAEHEEALAMLRAVIHPDFFDSLRSSGRSTADVAALITSVLAPWLAAREATRRPPSG
jgi:AcrR family transcriptional regulator